MPLISRRRKLTLSALVALTVWLALVIGSVLWWRPQFWIAAGQRFDRASGLAAQQRWSESLAEINRALDRDPRNIGYLTFKGYRQLDLGDHAGARATFARALELDRTHNDARLGLADALAKAGRHEQALTTLASMQAESARPSELLRRSQLYSMLGAPQLALDDVSALLREDPDNLTYLKNAAELSLMVKDWERAEPFLFRLSVQSEDAAVQQWAEKHHEMVRGTSGTDALTRRRLDAHVLRAAGDLRGAERLFRDLLTEAPSDAHTRVVYAWMLNTQRRYVEAWQVLQPLPRPASDTDVLELQARTAAWAGLPAEAVQLLTALLKRRPHDAELWRELAEAWRKLGDERQTADALSSYVRLRSQDWRAREHLAQLIAKNGSLDAAIQHYRQLTADNPDPEFLQSLGVLYETGGQLEPAAETYLLAAKRTVSPKPELALRLARVHRWLGRHESAMQWYGQFLDTTADDDLRRSASGELALTLLELGRPTDALERLAAAGRSSPLNAQELVTAARAATSTGRPADAVSYLELLSQTRALTPEERSWLASQYRAAGDRIRSLAAYDRAANETVTPQDEVLEAIGDLRYDGADFAGALQAFERVSDHDRVALKVARSAARAGRLSVASDAYERYVRANPNNLQGRLDAARYQASAGRPELAIAHYRAFISGSSATDLRLELARVHLAAKQFAEAESWARQAIAAGENEDESTLALAQSLHLQGRHVAARAALGRVMQSARLRKETDQWSGYVASAMDRHLEAFRAFERAIAAGATDDTPQLLLLQSAAALKRGDQARALRALSAAERSGQVPAAADAARRQLRAATLPTLYVPVWSAGDSNDLFVTQGGAGVSFFLPANRGRLSVEASSATFSQRGFSSRADSVKFRLSQLFPTPELSVDLAIGLNHYDRASERMTWQATALYTIADGTAVGLDAVRDALLPAIGRGEIRQFTRVLDVRALGPSFQSTTFRGFLELTPIVTHQSRVEGGVERLQDGNRRSFAYLHHQLPIESSARAWTALRPNLFFETFRRESPFYFSPRRHLTVGTMLHMIRRRDTWELEWEVNPQLLRTDGATGGGAHGLFNLAARFRGAIVGGGAFVFWDGLEDHVQWRVGGRVSIPLAR